MRSVASLSAIVAFAVLTCTACNPFDSNDAAKSAAAEISPPVGGLRKVTVDASSNAGTLRSLQGVNGAPGAHFHKPNDFPFGGWNMLEEIDATAGYRLARIDLVRTHDAYGPGDIDPRFGARHCRPPSVISDKRDVLGIFPNADADPEDPQSYNFGPTDQLIASIENIGAQTLFRIGRSECSHVDPPKDLDRYASIVEHIVLHYNQGWANGFRYGIKYWEVWNEPDLGKLFWGGSPDAFYELYGKIAHAVKRADPQALIGGPAIARPNDASAYRDPFMAYVRDQNLPLDFYSWHWYATDSNDPMDIIRVARDIRSRLDAHGLTQTQSVINEWNYGLQDPLPLDLQRAGFLTSTLVYMQDAPIDVSAIYRADNLFGSDGDTPNKVGQALVALGSFKDTPERLKVTGADSDGFAVQAGRSPDGGQIQVLVSNYQIPKIYNGPRRGRNVLSVPPLFDVTLLERRTVKYRDNAGYDLTIGNLPAGSYSVERYRISAKRDFQLVKRTTQTGSLVRVQANLPPPGIELISIRKLDSH